ncbi:MAG: PcfJ domain-containing protein [Planctomycetota bacterium]
MSRRKQPPPTPDRDAQQHIHALGLVTAKEYLAWCEANGFAERLNKRPEERDAERSLMAQRECRKRHKKRKREQRRPVDAVTAICRGELFRHEVSRDDFKWLCGEVARAQSTESSPVDTLCRLFTQVHRARTRLLDYNPSYIRPLVQVARQQEHWLRPLEAWKPRSKNAAGQFSSLLRHLFCRYPGMPRLFDSVWTVDRYREEHRQWFLHVGRGGNLRTAELPIDYTKKMAHFFMQGPPQLSVEQALVWGQVRALGGDSSLARTCAGTRMVGAFQQNEFWLSVIRWLIDNPSVPHAEVAPLCDYLHDQRHVGLRGWGQFGPPAHPQLTMRSRRPETLLRDVRRWHAELAAVEGVSKKPWKASGIEGFAHTVKQPGEASREWRISELVSPAALRNEGATMRHCVATYALSCLRGQCSIWSVRATEGRRVTSALTVEVRHRQIVQARGKANRMPTEDERSILQQWARTAGLTVGWHV